MRLPGVYYLGGGAKLKSLVATILRASTETIMMVVQLDYESSLSRPFLGCKRAPTHCGASFLGLLLTFKEDLEERAPLQQY